MSELKQVALSSLHSNPFRDLDEFPLIQGKLDRLQESIAAEGFWEGVIARPAKSGYEIAFGHHRVYAAKKELGDDAKVPVIVRDLTDDKMLHFMSRENAEEYGHDFYYTTVQDVSARVKALAAGAKVEGGVKTEQGARKDQWRLAPSFIKGGGSGAGASATSQTYTAESLAVAMGKVKKGSREGRVEPQAGVLTALDVLELIEEKGMKPRAIMGLDHGAVREVVVAAKQAADRARQEAAARDKRAAEAQAAKEAMAKLDAERAAREYAAKVKREGEEKAKREAKELADAKAKYVAEQEASRKAVLEAKREADKAALDAKIVAAKDVTEKLKTQTVAAVQDERKAKLLVVTPPPQAPVRATDLTPRLVRLQEEAARLAANLESFIAMVRDPGNAAPIRELRKLVTVVGECAEKGREVARIVEKRTK